MPSCYLKIRKISTLLYFYHNDYELFKVLINKVTFYETCENMVALSKTFILTPAHLENGQFKQSLPFDFPVALKPANSVEWLSIDFEGRKKHLLLITGKNSKLLLNEFIKLAIPVR